jgi:serine protease Do
MLNYSRAASSLSLLALVGACQARPSTAEPATKEPTVSAAATSSPAPAPPAVPAPGRADKVPEAREVGEAFVAVAEQLAPAVVRITTREQASPAGPFPGSDSPLEGSPLERFFEQFGNVPQAAPEARIGTGSGVVIDEAGHILTNQHVVANASDVRVTFVDGKELSAKIVGTDAKTDLAVIQVEGAQVRAAQFGSSDAMHVGEWVMAIGNPFGLDHSVTVGVLSAKGRYGFAPGKLEDFLQTDASINPGNSGGPLVNLNGQVIGINTMIAGIGTGVGFAVSEAIARPISQQLIEQGKVVRPYLGISMQPLTPSVREALGTQAPEKGALVAEIQKGSPAEQAGVQAGDLIVALDDKPVQDSREVQQAVLQHKVGESVNLTLWREGQTVRLAVRTAELPNQAPAARSTSKDDGVGLELRPLTPELADRLGVAPGTHGVVVSSIHPGSAAAEAGLRPGDVLTSIDRKPVSNPRDAARALGAPRAGGHLVLIQRGDASSFVVLPTPP